jgi:hypothetical protein
MKTAGLNKTGGHDVLVYRDVANQCRWDADALRVSACTAGGQDGCRQ